MCYNLLDGIPAKNRQEIYECISQAIGCDLQETTAKMEARTQTAVPFIKWDLVYRNLMNYFDSENLLYSSVKRGCWVVLLLYYPELDLLLSFMKKKRFSSLRASNSKKRPAYLKALVSLNSKIQADYQQESFFEGTSCAVNPEAVKILGELCQGFNSPVNKENLKHAVVVFDENGHRITELNAYILNGSFEILCHLDFLEKVHPVMDNSIESYHSESLHETNVSLTAKALQRKAKRDFLVSLAKDDGPVTEKE